ncbi:TonB-dependent receptor [Thalassotalea profundi]|uniref:TonB-dependent receptor n=1 Tax=Thalassotalea profundi TaxID=2036687 RepID=A0ABQ3J3K7_9GAMM|nr:TonB-dependent receptor [Thalassotalea profundi]GHF00218.1 hypothetical protein GCM10011501_32120 [Thalassotalea profundi]
MKLLLKPSVIAIQAILCSSTLFNTQTIADEIDTESIDVITITHQRHQGLSDNKGIAVGKTSEPDLASWLSTVPGASVNKNGPVTGIAQYRGLYGDRLSIALDGHLVIGAGPNAMDPPLSYSTPLIVESMTVYRGVAPVVAGMNTLAGAINVNMRKAEFSQSDSLHMSGDMQAGYRSNNDADTLSAVVNIGKNQFATMAYVNVQSGENFESGSRKTVAPSAYEKRQMGADFRYQQNDTSVGLNYHYTDTQDSGTPALPMDIEYIFSHRLAIDGEFIMNNWQASWTLGYVDADHGMTNFLMRENDDMTKHRRNNATAETVDFTFTLEQGFEFGQLLFGFDGYSAAHDSVITNPNNMMFEVINFNDVVDERIAIFGQWQQDFDDTQVQLGVRIKHVSAEAGEVATSMAMMSMPNRMETNIHSEMNMDLEATMMPSMAELAMTLRDNFNNADRSQSDTLVDIALNIETVLSQSTSFNAGIGVKNRAPSYQERYLWTPMESTGGLADGNTYIGNINLKEETAYQSNIGLTYQESGLMLAPQIFYQRIDDYIQGTSLTMMDMSASMMAQMMSGDDNPLKFTNVDAKLYGIDVNWNYQLTDNLEFFGVASYVKGERRDIDDSLYRITPLNTRITARYNTGDWLTDVEVVLAAKQDDVSITNQEKATAGYGLVNLNVNYYVNSALTLRAGVDNVFDKDYRHHLGGYNRVNNSEIEVMQRLPSEGVSAWAEVSYNF